VHDDHRGDHQAQAAADGQAGCQGHAVEEAVQAHAQAADEADVTVGRVAVLELRRGLVPDVQRSHLLDRVERQEADRGEGHREIQRPTEVLDALRDEVEVRGPDPDSRPGRDDQADMSHGAHGEEAAEERGGERSDRDEDGGEWHR
jgi:hypothetical protein